MNIQARPLERSHANELSKFRVALDYEAPFLIEKLVKNQIADNAVEAEQLFAELKKYLVLSILNRDAGCEMYSLRVDEVWHQFVLYTSEYASYCRQFLGEFVHHRPNNAPKLPLASGSRRSTFSSFQKRYAEIFGEELPDCWLDAKSITVARRLFNYKAGHLVVSEESGRISLVGEEGFVHLSIDAIAREALTFIASTAAFYVRELPGGLTDEERIAIAAALVEQRLLLVAP